MNLRFLVAMAFAIACATSASAQAAVADAITCVSPPDAARPPAYPDAAARERLGGRVLLEIAVDACGAPLDVAVAESSGHAVLDAAAVDAAKTWRLASGRAGAKLRVPVLFSPERGAQARLARTHDAQFAQRRAMTAAAPTLNANGKVPGFIADPLPLGYATVADAHREVVPVGSKAPSFDENFDTVLVIDDEGLSTWSFAIAGTDFWPAVVRQRAVGDGTRGFWVTSVLCEARDASACEALRSWLGRFPAQKDAPPPPPALGD